MDLNFRINSKNRQIKNQTIILANERRILKDIIRILRKAIGKYPLPLCNQIKLEYGKKPFLILVGCLLSLRAKDATIIHVCRQLFKIAQTPKEILSIPQPKLKKILFKTGFYKTKTKTLREVCKNLLEKHKGKVPNTLEELLSIKGIGRKTANLVLGLGYGIPGICVDTHVHRISNRLGIIKTKTPKETEEALKKILPKKYWIEWNNLIVTWGQNICTPISPWCSKCAIKSYCKRIDVKKSR